MRVFPVYGVIIGLLWTGPSWAGGDFCVAHGRMVGAVAKARAAGATEAAIRAALLTPQTPEVVRGLVDTNITRVYASADAPEIQAAKAEAVCRTVKVPSASE